jgi:hypothetical protein
MEPICPRIAESCSTPTCTTWKTVTVPANNPPFPYTLTFRANVAATCIPYCPKGCKTLVKTVVLPKPTEP